MAKFRPKIRISSSVTSKLVPLGLVLFALLTSVSYQNCSGNLSTETASTSAALSTTKPASSSPATATGPQAQLQLSQPTAPPAANLGTQLVIPFKISSSNSYAGTVKLSVATTELSAVDPGQGITFTFSQPNVRVSDASPVSGVVMVNISTMAPSFNGSLFHIVATDTADSTITTSVSVPLQVKAVYNVNIAGPAAPPEVWSIPVGADVKFIAHSEGLTVNFNNLDPVSVHLIHSTSGASGPIMHESTTATYPGTSIVGLPPASNGGSTAGGTYTQVVPPATTSSTSQVWDHLNESSTQARTMEFNVAVPQAVVTLPPLIPPPGSTFSNLNSTIFQVTCVGCHSGTAPKGNFSMTSLSSILTRVTPGNANTSPLYNQLASGAMPQGGTALTSAQLAQVAGWINSGAANN